MPGERWANRVRTGNPKQWTGYLGVDQAVMALITNVDPTAVDEWVAGERDAIPNAKEPADG